MNLQPGHLLNNGKYKIVRFIASGGFGFTYEAVHTMLKTRVAIKEFFWSDKCYRDASSSSVIVTNPSYQPDYNKLMGKFVEEATVLFNLHHPGIVHVTDIFEENGTSYFVMDYIDGQSVKDIVKLNGPMHHDIAADYIRQIASALREVHAHNRLHLDIKPANIMVDSTGRAILIDFGASKQWNDQRGFSSSLVLMSKGYAPPEQVAQGVQAFTAATDIYALGATSYYMLTGIEPPESTMLAIGEVSLQPLPASVPQALVSAVYSAMQLNRNVRPQSIDEFIAILDQGSQPHTYIVGQPVRQPEQPTQPYQQPPQKPYQPEPQPAGKSNTGKIALIAVLALLLCVCVGAIIYINSDPTPATSPAGGNDVVMVDTVAAVEEAVEVVEPVPVSAGYTSSSGNIASQGSKYLTGYVIGAKGQKCNISMWVYVDEFGDYSGKYCYDVTVRKYGDKPQSYFTISGSSGLGGDVTMYAYLHGKSEPYERWNCNVNGRVMRGDLTNLDNGTVLPFYLELK